MVFSRKRTILPFIMSVFFTFSLVGCGGGALIDSPITDQERARVLISFDWQDFDGDQVFAQSLEGPLTVSSVGARLEYVEENASFTQAVSRQTASEQGVITLEVPPTRRANLFIVAVHEGERYRSERALYLGTIHDLALERGTVQNIAIDNFKIVKAEWYVVDSHLNDYLSGSFTANKDEEFFYLPILVRDPYQVGQKPSRGNTIIKAAGRSSQRENDDGWRRIDVAAANTLIGGVHDKDEAFWPYLDGSLFNLNETYYYIGEEGTFTARWR